MLVPEEAFVLLVDRSTAGVCGTIDLSSTVDLGLRALVWSTPFVTRQRKRFFASFLVKEAPPVTRTLGPMSLGFAV